MRDDHRSHNTDRQDLVTSEEGAIGYILSWVLGVPVSILFVVFLLRGCT